MTQQVITPGAAEQVGGIPLAAIGADGRRIGSADSLSPASLAIPETPALRVDSISKSFGESVVLDGVSLDVARGELVALLGPSGCGKTTLLRIIAGLEQQHAGRVCIEGADVTRLPPAARGCGVVFQSYALFPNLTAGRNVDFGIDRRRFNRAARAKRVDDLLALVGLSAERDKRPAELSGGQQQRVALARALAAEPSVLLLDEPLSALDVKVRARLRAEIRRLQRELKLTTILVTHDQEEALTTADRVAVMHRGRVEQVGTPREVYQRPATAYVADFVGATNLLTGWTTGERGTVRKGPHQLRTGEDLEAGMIASVAFRPEDGFLLTSNGAAADCGSEDGLPVRIDRVEFRGATLRVYVRLDGEPAAEAPLAVDVPSRDAARFPCRAGSNVVYLHLRPEAVRLFSDPEGVR